MTCQKLIFMVLAHGSIKRADINHQPFIGPEVTPFESGIGYWAMNFSDKLRCHIWTIRFESCGNNPNPKLGKQISSFDLEISTLEIHREELLWTWFWRWFLATFRISGLVGEKDGSDWSCQVSILCSTERRKAPICKSIGFYAGIQWLHNQIAKWERHGLDFVV